MDLDRALAFSRYAERALTAHPALRDEIVATLDVRFDWHDALRDVEAAVAADDPLALATALRVLRRRALVHTLVRDLTGRADFAEVAQAMTALAECSLAAAVELHTRSLAATFGLPRADASNDVQQLIVVGMGKLGGSELNVSSDVDLVFVYPEEGETDGAKRISNREFFDRLGQRIVAALGHVDANGYVFRVDTRLRPYGESGPLSVSFAALERYLVTQGRTWERYAWLKARPLTGVRHDELAALVTPFVYRKYLDYDAYEGLRGVHRQIREQESRHDDDIKLGRGGIREIEFVVQALQIVRGGREPALRVRATLPALAALTERGVVAAHAAAVLRDGYLFLRALEHRLQYRDDRQTQRLPVDEGERTLLAETLGFAARDEFERSLAARRQQVARQFDAVFQAPEDDTSNGDRLDRYASLWDEPQPAPAMLAALEREGFAAPAEIVDTLARLRASRRYLQLPALSRDRFDRLVPRLVAVASEQRSPGAPPAVVLGRLLGLLEAISTRSAYLALLSEHPPLLPRLAQLMGASAWAADYLTRRPLVLDELLDARVLLAEPDWNGWRTELDRLLAPHVHDAEGAMDTLRHFQHAQSFRLLAQDLAGQMSVERLADHLSALADTILDATLRCCWRQLQGDDAPSPRFAIAGYGKLGGKELGYVSDLDLVFLYDDDERTEADDAFVRYARLAQRINTWLSAATGAGRLYETDLRLRPDGAKGLLVSGIRGFERYQREQAWTWEHQALTRARFVAGDAALGAMFEATRDELLRLPREPRKLATDIVEMRERMAAGHVNRTHLFDLKHDRGGMVDIEFAVQFLVLAYAHAHRELTRNAGNIALLSIAADAALLPRPLALQAADAYRQYRRLQHQVRLTGAAHARVDPVPQATRRAAVDALWQHVFGAPRSA